MAIKQGLNEWHSYLQELSSNIRNKLKEFMEIKKKGRDILLKHLFKELYQSYERKIEHREIEIKEKPEDYRRFIEWEIKSQIHGLFRSTNTETHLSIKMYNKEITTDVYEDLLVEFPFLYDVTLDIENKTIKIIHFRSSRLINKPLFFESSVDYFLTDLINSMNDGHKKIIVEYEDAIHEKIVNFFTNEFKRDFKNSLFEFQFIDSREGNHFTIKFKKLC